MGPGTGKYIHLECWEKSTDFVHSGISFRTWGSFLVQRELLTDKQMRDLFSSQSNISIVKEKFSPKNVFSENSTRMTLIYRKW